MSIICGVDVSSTHLDARVGPDGPEGRFPNTPQGVDALAAFCKDHGVTLVAMEATGGYERLPFTLLWGHGLPGAVKRESPRCSSAQPSPESSSFASTPKHAMREKNSPMQLDSPDSRSPERERGNALHGTEE